MNAQTIGRIARVNGTGQPVITINWRRTFEACVGSQVACLLARARVSHTLLTVIVARASELELELTPGSLIAERLAVGRVGELSPRADAAPLGEELVRHPGVDIPMSVEDVPALGVLGAGVRGLDRGVEDGVADLIVRALGEMRPEERRHAGNVRSGLCKKSANMGEEKESGACVKELALMTMKRKLLRHSIC